MRQSNIELLRLISIFLVLIVHTTFRSLGMAECSSFSLLLLAALSVVGVNVFVFITGYFSATPKKTALCQIAFICLFWGIIKIICYAFFHQQIEMKNLFFITDSNWFIPSYICLLFLAPFLNEGCKMMTQKQLRGGGTFFIHHQDLVRLDSAVPFRSSWRSSRAWSFVVHHHIFDCKVR